jgi:hypothetical protein
MAPTTHVRLGDNDALDLVPLGRVLALAILNVVKRALALGRRV